MQSTNVLVPCKSCKTKVPVGDLRMNNEGMFVCNTCFSHGYMTNARIQDLTPNKFKAKEEKKEVKPIVREVREHYYCTNCKFSFTRPLGAMNRGCPYCNKEHTVQKRESASDLLKNIDDSYFG